MTKSGRAEKSWTLFAHAVLAQIKEEKLWPLTNSTYLVSKSLVNNSELNRGDVSLDIANLFFIIKSSLGLLASYKAFSSYSL